MNYDLQQQLKEYFHAPEPERKNAFVRELRRQDSSILTLLKSQICYIPKYVWLVFALLFSIALFCSYLVPAGYMGSIYALTPFFVMVSITESMRSYRYGMQELEQACRFSLKSIILARMVLLGTGNFLMILLLALFGRYPVLSQLLYMAVPYLATAVGELIIIRRFPNREGTCFCFGFSTLIAFSIIGISIRFAFIYEMAYLSLWGMICFLFLALLLREIYRTILITEEYVWN